MRRDQIALQLYTVRRLLATDLPGTLAAVAEVGYRSVELAGLPDMPPDERHCAQQAVETVKEPALSRQRIRIILDVSATLDPGRCKVPDETREPRDESQCDRVADGPAKQQPASHQRHSDAGK